MRADARELFETALPLVARRIESHDGKVPADELGEEAHLRPATVAALEGAARMLGLPVVLRTEHPFQTVDWGSRAGVDIGIRGLPQLAPVFCELKWGAKASVLGECSWDLAKMGLAVAKRACSAALLLAGAPQRRWTQPGLEGAEQPGREHPDLVTRASGRARRGGCLHPARSPWRERGDGLAHASGRCVR